MRRAICVVTVFLVASSQAFAWSDAGHKIIASIAFSKLNPAERKKVVRILVDHPRFKSDFLDQIPDDVYQDEAQRSEWLFQQASVWPDIAGGFTGDDRKFHHPSSHFINVPSYLNNADERALEDRIKVNDSLEPPATTEETMNAVQTIRLARAMLLDPKVKKPQKSVALAWLFHLVGDIHQPLHSTALFSQRLFPEGDGGGNLILTKQRGNLHSVWDGFLGGKASLKDAHQDALNLLADPELARVGDRSAVSLDEKVWLEESRKFAADYAYRPLLPYLQGLEKEGGELQPITLQEDYLVTGGAISKMCAVMAGYRLAGVLKEIVN